MAGKRVDLLYDSLADLLTEDNRLPEVENAYEEGKPCSILYTSVCEANRRICERFGVDFDEDVESIISDMMEICRILGYKMYEYGAKYGKIK